MCTHIIAEVAGKGKPHVGKMDAIITTASHLDTRIKTCILMSAIVPKLEYEGEVWEGSANLVTQLETVEMTGSEKIVRCSSTTIISNNAVFLRSALGMHPLQTMET